jgi:hypothetical protein
MVPLLTPDGGLNATTRLVLENVTGVPDELLRNCRIRPRSRNLLRAPWFAASRGGGAMVLGRVIYFTPNWFARSGPHARGDGSLESTQRWLQHLAHEVGHLPQARAFGYGALGRTRYVGAFTAQYLWRAVRLKRDVHDGAPLEREAEAGAQALRQLIGTYDPRHPLVLAVHTDDLQSASAWLATNKDAVARAVRNAGADAQRPA